MYGCVEPSVKFFFFFLAYSGFYHSCFLFFKKDVQWSFPVFHIKKKTHLQTKQHVSCQKQFHTTTSVIGDMFVTQGRLYGWHAAVTGWGWLKRMTCCWPTFRSCIRIKSRVHCETFSGHILFVSRYTGLSPQTGVVLLRVRYIDRLDSALFCVVGCVMKNNKKKQKKKTKHLSF